MKRIKYFTLFTVLGAVCLIQSCASVNLHNGNVSNNTNDTIVRLYLGLSSENGEQEIEIGDVENILSNHFDGATLQEATGLYKGVREQSLIITIINCCTWQEPEEDFLNKLKVLVSELKLEFSQESILVEHTSSGETRVFEIMQ